MIGSPLATGSRGLLLSGQVRPVLPSQFAVPQGLVGYWGFDPDCLDFNQNIALDISGSNLTATLHGSPALAVGQVGSALKFNGTSGYVATTANSPVPGAQARSYSLWMFVSSLPGVEVGIIAAGTDLAKQSFSLFIEPSPTAGELYLYGHQLDWHSASGVIAVGVWNHVVVTYNGGAAEVAGNVLMYCNGQSLPLTLAGAQTGAYATTTGPLYIGAWDVGPAEFFPGTIDDVRLYSRAIDPWEVITLYRAGLAGRRDAGAPALPALFVSAPSPVFKFATAGQQLILM